ncbi:MAG: glycosyltransferase [Alkalinema sp. RL_2_19]|nr:glycosyltransferase [Alkalinema sp. RL_2_19]
MSTVPTALIYRFKLLPFSETFIHNQAESLREFQPHYLGLRSVPGIATVRGRTTILNPDQTLMGKVRETRFKLFGQMPNLALRPRLIHAHFADDGAIALPLAQRLNLPLVVTCHGYEILSQRSTSNHSTYQRLYRYRKPLLQRTARLFIGVSDFLTQELIKQGFPTEKVVRHYIGIDTAKFRPDPAMQRQPIVLFTGRLVEKKGCEYLLRAMADVQRVLPQVKLVVIGDGRLRQPLAAMAHQTLANYEFLGAQTADVVRAWMARSQVFCVPSITADCGDAETFGMVFAEAQAMGLPVVSFASGGIPESVSHEKTGLLAAERDWQGLAKHILDLLQQPQLWQRFSCQGPEYVRRNFDLATQTRKLEALYYDRVLSADVAHLDDDYPVSTTRPWRGRRSA